MPTLTVAVSEKGLASLARTELGKLLEGAKVLEDGSREITIDASIDTKLQTAKGERGGKHNALADRLIAKVADARAVTAEAVEAPASAVRG